MWDVLDIDIESFLSFSAHLALNLVVAKNIYRLRRRVSLHVKRLLISFKSFFCLQVLASTPLEAPATSVSAHFRLQIRKADWATLVTLPVGKNNLPGVSDL